jgi:hypothetical protein
MCMAYVYYHMHYGCMQIGHVLHTWTVHGRRITYKGNVAKKISLTPPCGYSPHAHGFFLHFLHGGLHIGADGGCRDAPVRAT